LFTIWTALGSRVPELTATHLREKDEVQRLVHAPDFGQSFPLSRTLKKKGTRVYEELATLWLTDAIRKDCLSKKYMNHLSEEHSILSSLPWTDSCHTLWEATPIEFMESLDKKEFLTLSNLCRKTANSTLKYAFDNQLITKWFLRSIPKRWPEVRGYLARWDEFHIWLSGPFLFRLTSVEELTLKSHLEAHLRSNRNKPNALVTQWETGLNLFHSIGLPEFLYGSTNLDSIAEMVRISRGPIGLVTSNPFNIHSPEWRRVRRFTQKSLGQQAMLIKSWQKARGSK
jgi:hypothetical protein